MKKLLILMGGVALCLSSCTKKVAYQMVKPLPAPYAVNQLQDATVPASFSSKDISWENSKLSMEVFSEDLYDAVAVINECFHSALLGKRDSKVIDNSLF